MALKKIISYSIWGDDPKYLDGALANIRNQQEFYPGWICRFYIHDEVPKYFWSLLKDKNIEIVTKSGNLGSGMDRPGMFWRFEVLKDPEVERFIVRDTDSRMGIREKICVKDWIASKKNFHIIRDHQYHSTRIMGGMWGATKSIIDRLDYDDLINQFSKLEYNNVYATDQEFLARMVYPLIKGDACIHDDYHFYKDETPRGIPHIKVKDDFIGKPIDV